MLHQKPSEKWLLIGISIETTDKKVQNMTQIIDAIYEEGVLKPLKPLNIQEHTKVRIIINSEKDTKRPPLNFPVDSFGSWPQNLSLRREDIYDDK